MFSKTEKTFTFLDIKENRYTFQLVFSFYEEGYVLKGVGVSKRCLPFSSILREIDICLKLFCLPYEEKYVLNEIGVSKTYLPFLDIKGNRYIFEINLPSLRKGVCSK